MLGKETPTPAIGVDFIGRRRCQAPTVKAVIFAMHSRQPNVSLSGARVVGNGTAGNSGAAGLSLHKGGGPARCAVPAPTVATRSPLGIESPFAGFQRAVSALGGDGWGVVSGDNDGVGRPRRRRLVCRDCPWRRHAKAGGISPACGDRVTPRRRLPRPPRHHRRRRAVAVHRSPPTRSSPAWRESGTLCTSARFLSVPPAPPVAGAAPWISRSLSAAGDSLLAAGAAGR